MLCSIFFSEFNGEWVPIPIRMTLYLGETITDVDQMLKVLMLSKSPSTSTRLINQQILWETFSYSVFQLSSHLLKPKHFDFDTTEKLDKQSG
jgi:hypothetical protein